MGGARNLKLEGQRGGKGQGTGAIIFVWAKCRPYAVVVCIKKIVAGQGVELLKHF